MASSAYVNYVLVYHIQLDAFGVVANSCAPKVLWQRAWWESLLELNVERCTDDEKPAKLSMACWRLEPS